MDKAAITIEAEEFARIRMKNYDPGHDWWHVLRVRNNAFIINSREESADPFLLDIAAIIHDVADSKFNSDDKYSDVNDFLKSSGLYREADRLISAVRNISFSNKQPSGNLNDPLFMILQDADRLDAIGAVGIARAFSYGAWKGNPLYVPSAETGGAQGTTIHHFYDKLLKLKDRMNTTTGKNLAEERHRFLEVFLEQFYFETDEGRI